MTMTNYMLKTLTNHFEWKRWLMHFTNDIVVQQGRWISLCLKKRGVDGGLVLY